MLSMFVVTLKMQDLDSQGNEKKNANSISNAFSENILIRNENVISKEHKTKSYLS